MCGIAGIFDQSGAPIGADRLAAMTHAIRHRGPDGDGFWVSADGRVGFGHRRLAIIDLSPSGRQPMHHQGGLTITYNGEVYNYVELKRELEAAGHRFQSASDTEVLLAGYAEHGESFLARVDGMFAFALWDDRRKVLLCARDRFGEKPFFYSQAAPGAPLLFGSEIKALAAGGVPLSPNRRSLFDYLAWDVVQSADRPGETFYEGVRSLRAGHVLEVDARGRATERAWWTLAPSAEPPPRSLDDAAERFAELFQGSVRRRLRSDVPLGVNLSGGLDSASVACTVRQILGADGPRINTFSARFHDPELDEGRFMALAAARAEATAHETWPDESVLADVLDRVFHHQEEPFGSASMVAQWDLMRLAHDRGVTVLLDGQGSDEMLGGYLHYFDPYLKGLLLQDPRLFTTERAAIVRRHGVDPAAAARFGLDARLPQAMRIAGRVRRALAGSADTSDLEPEFAAAHGGRPPFKGSRTLGDALRHSVEGYGLEKLLRALDRSAMAFSRETRLPFLSHDLVQFVFSLPDAFKIHDGWTKLVLRRAMEPVLPPEITWRVDKQGFQPPERQWLGSARLHPMVAASVDRLRRERILRAPAPGREWRYLMAARVFDFLR